MKSEIKERPILFSTAMVKKILSGEKTQTRRVLRRQPKRVIEQGVEVLQKQFYPQKCWKDAFAVRIEENLPDDEYPLCYPIEFCQYGKIGDRLWVRESAFISDKNFTHFLNMAADHKKNPLTTPKDYDGDYRYVGFCADLPNGDSERAREYGIKKYPSIHMPRWASRITLEITNIRVERLQDISEDDAEAEGVDILYMPPDDIYKFGATSNITNKKLFEILWNKINAKRGFGWDKNNFVWAITFKRIEN